MHGSTVSSVRSRRCYMLSRLKGIETGLNDAEVVTHYAELLYAFPFEGN